MAVVRILGRSGTGKTTFIEAFVRACPQMSVAVVKHSRTAMDPPPTSKDTARHYAAGAVASVGLSPGYAEVFLGGIGGRRRNQKECGSLRHSLERVLAALDLLLGRSPDLVLVEGARDLVLPTILLGPLPPRAVRGTILLRLPARPVFNAKMAGIVLEQMAQVARVVGGRAGVRYCLPNSANSGNSGNSEFDQG